MSRVRKQVWALRALCAALAVVLSVGMAGCKPTDFFVEKIITPAADSVDENNPNQIMINSPDAEQESESLAALDWTEDSAQSEEQQTLVVWSQEPNTTMTTHHSVFDVAPRFPGILASDGVKLVFSSTATLEGDVQADVQTDADASSSSSGAGKVSTDPNAPAGDSSMVISGDDADSDNADQGDEQGSGEGTSGEGTQQGAADNGQGNQGDSDAEGEGSGAGDNPSPDPGRQPDYGGYGGEVKTFQPNSALEDPPLVNSIGVIGQQAAVLVQAIGGKGAISSMSSYDYANTAVNSAESFSNVFSDEFDAASVYLWDAADSSDLSQIDAARLVQACGYDGLIIYDKNVFYDETALNAALPEDVKKETYGYNIQFMCADLSSIELMSQSGTMVGKALSSSTSLAEGWSSTSLADQYTLTLVSLSTELANVRKSTTEYVSMATDAATGIGITFGTSGSLSSQLLLFTDYAQDSYKPLSEWVSDVGVKKVTLNAYGATESADAGKGALSLMYPTLTTDVTLTGSSSAISSWTAAGKHLNQMIESGTSGDTSGGMSEGVGSSDLPYLVVAGSSDGSLTATQVASAAESSIAAYEDNQMVTLYAAFHRATGSIPDSAPFTRSYIGESRHLSENPLIGSTTTDTRTRIRATVRANPTGVLGSWTDASFESALEAVWMAALYSEAPFDGSPYQPESDWSGISVTVGNTSVACTSTSAAENAEDIIRQFYEAFYRTNYCPELDLGA